MSKVTILLTGATGYIGGSILQGLLQHPDAKRFEISTLIRDSAKAKILEETFGVKTTLGSIADQDKLTALAENAHIVIHTADSSDNVDAMKAILKGLKVRHEKSGDVPHLVHTSGTGVLIDFAKGEHASSPILSDVDQKALDAIPPDAFHRSVELLAIEADEKDGYVRTHIVSPAVIYGLGHGPLFDAGIANPFTFAILVFVRAALKRGNVGVEGKGASIWQSVHIDDLVDLYIRVVDAIVSDPGKISHGRAGYFIAENGGQTMAELLQSIAEGLFALGRISSPTLVPYAPGEAGQYLVNQFIADVLFSNSRCKAERARRELGWNPKYTSRDFLDIIKSEVKEYVKKADAAKAD
ncbi:NAD-P-binding protein [Trametes coccinea BRFM310]|uniref:NAD-P-binding protein n=1 Tax=Trametes coccinea (strain BRFM310) TaxID=1353009 RepID=A0A1Y2ICS8_TRAC3|nr:NAD-P-binding protein [Trametes coccinea BRFM310]